MKQKIKILFLVLGISGVVVFFLVNYLPTNYSGAATIYITSTSSATSFGTFVNNVNSSLTNLNNDKQNNLTFPLGLASTTGVQATILFPIPVASTSLSAGLNLMLSGNTLSATTTPSFVSLTLPSITGSFLATNANGLVIATTTPSLSNSGLTATSTAGQYLTKNAAVFVASTTSNIYFSFNNASSNTTCFGDVSPSPNKVAQNFFFQSTTTINSVRVALGKCGSPTDNVILSLQASSSGNPSGIMLASTTINYTALTANTTTSYVYSFPKTELSGGKGYFLVFERSGTLDGSNNYGTRNGSDALSGTTQFTYTSGAWSDVGTDLYFGLEYNATSGLVYQDTANCADCANNFIGFANDNYAVGDTANIVVVGTVNNFSNLSFGRQYYLSNSPGEISTTAGNSTRKVGISVSTTTLVITNSW